MDFEEGQSIVLAVPVFDKAEEYPANCWDNKTAMQATLDMIKARGEDAFQKDCFDFKTEIKGHCVDILTQERIRKVFYTIRYCNELPSAEDYEEFFCPATKLLNYSRVIVLQSTVHVRAAHAMNAEDSF